jgi:coupling of ubiquitin conjugation to ER degradation protein 1
VETVRGMFPNIPSAAIVASLQTTGSVEITIEHALRDGTLPLVSYKPYI